MQSSSESCKLTIIHFNDCYNLEPREKEPCGGISRFASAIKSFAHLDPLLMFSGDLFSPSNLSNVYRGKQMIDPINLLNVKVACIGNHDFDFDIDETVDLIAKTNFPWLLTNITDLDGKQIVGTKPYFVFEHNGLKVGTVGLAEYEWIETLHTITSDDVQYEDFVTCGTRFAKMLRETENCDVVIALTHMRNPRDYKLAEGAEGIDLILGGHDHVHLIEKRNDVNIIKSGADFREFNVISLTFYSPETLADARAEPLKYPQINPEKLSRDKFIMDVETVNVDSKWKPDSAVEKSVEVYMKDFEKSMNIVIGHTQQPIDCRFEAIRSIGTNGSDFIADIARMVTESDIAILNSGTLRIDCVINEGHLRIKEMFGMLPFIDPIIKIEMNGKQILEALENGVSQYPALEGRFPMISGISFSFDPSKPPMHRVPTESVKLGEKSLNLEGTYIVATKYFLAQGKDGYDVFAKCKHLTDYESAVELRQELINFFKMVHVTEFKKIWEKGEDHHKIHEKTKAAHPWYLKKDTAGFRKKMDKIIRLSTLVSDVKEVEGHEFISVNLADNKRIIRIE